MYTTSKSHFEAPGCVEYCFAGRRFTSWNLKWGTVLFILSLIVIGGISAAALSPVAQAAGSEAPPFTLTGINGTTFNLTDYQGKVVVLDLMATWCPVCQVEMKELAQLRQEKTEVVILTVSVDPLETDDNLRDFKEKYNADWLFVRDTDRVLDKYWAFTLPTIVVIDPKGYISFRKAALVSTEELALEVEKAYSGGIEEPEEPERPGKAVPPVTGLYLLALLAGVMSFFAPCAFPLMPGYISYYLGRYEGGPTLRGSVKAGIASATGINGIFALIGAAVAVGGAAVKSYLMYLAPGVGFAIILLGLAMVFGKTEIFDRFWRGGILSSYSSKLGGGARYSGLFLYGVGYGLASMGCQAPVFIALIFAGLASGGALEALLIFLSFSVGMGTTMLTLSVIVGTAKMTILERVRKMVPYINRACGIILVIVGVYFLVEFI
ncbi:MAG: redoxin domain-containing protein [archaeon]|nr:redoxin domain-containing protein [archaeon]